nr:homoserine dehydrogenase [Alkaliphilus metalliredigens]
MGKIKIALLGMGTVGTGVWQIVHENKEEILRSCGYEIEVSKILVRDLEKKRNADIPQSLLTTNYEEIVNDKEIEIVVELMGGIEPAKGYIMKAIENKKHVVTANKALIASHGDEIIEKAKEKKVIIQYEASVGGGIPVLQAIKEGLSGNKIQEVMGIVNGTTNYILTKMTKEKVDFETVLKEAQDKGYAEADPTADIEGYDAAHKLTILASLSFGSNVNFDSVYREGITKITPLDIEYADELGYAIKLLAIGKEKDNEMELRVHPTFIPLSHPLAAVGDAFNAVFLKGNAVGELMFYGKGAGDLPTGSAVVGDMISIIKNKCNLADESLKTVDKKPNKSVKPMSEINCEYYIRVMVKDRPAVLGKIASLIGDSGVSLSTVIQKGEGDPSVSLVFITHRTNEGNIKRALDAIIAVPEVVELANLIRVENS